MKLLAFLAMAGTTLLLGCAHHHQATEPAAPAVASTQRTPYTKPITSLGAKFGMLPPAAQNTVRAEVGSTEVVDVIKEASADFLYYKVIFRDSLNFPPLLVAPDGSVLNPDLTVAMPAPVDATGSLPLSPVMVKDLPPRVRVVLAEQAPEDSVEAVSKEAWGNHLVYIITFKAEADRSKLYVVADGTVLTQAQPAQTKP